MPIFFIPTDFLTDQTLTIRGPLLRHIRDSLRVHRGEEIRVATETGLRYRARILTVTGSAITAEVLDRAQAPARQAPAVALAHALLKSDRMEWMIQKATELGVEEIVPLQTRRSVIRPKNARLPTQLERWNRIALEAAQQSERWTLPRIHAPVPCLEFFSEPRAPDTAFILGERVAGLSLHSVPLPDRTEVTVIIAIGPEGGWEQDELTRAVEGGFQTISMGARILRSETAALAALSILQSRLGELD